MLVTTLTMLGSAFGQSEDQIVGGIEQKRQETYKEFRNKKSTPLDKPDLKKFKGLKYYPIDLSFRVEGTLVRNPNPQLFQMKTTTSRLPTYFKYADVTFMLQGETYTLEVYRSPEIAARPGYADYYLVPFTDSTNGEVTYEVGRYLDVRLTESDETIVLDFNLAYNPYCSYSNRYSCPIPPKVNYLPIAVTAGEKKFKEGH